MQIQEGMYYINREHEILKATFNNGSTNIKYPFHMVYESAKHIEYTVTATGKWGHSDAESLLDIVKELSPKEYPEYYL
jgi:hypothetical protein